MDEIRSLTLQTERMILRELKEEDWQAVHEYGSDPETVKYMPFGPNTEQNTREFIQREITHQKEKPRIVYDFGLVNKIENKLIGTCCVSIRNCEHKEGEIGYILNRNYWNQGYITEAASRVVSFGFDDLGLHRIYATCDPANVGSYRVMKKIGMTREGHLREHRLFKGKYRDSLVCAILEQERRSDRGEEAKTETDGKIKREIEYIEKTPPNLDIIKPLWEKLVAHHKAVSKRFTERYSTINFEMRKKELLEKSAGGTLRIDLARDAITGEVVGYCVTSVTAEKRGEIESIYVEKDYRGYGIGDQLMVRALDWLDALSVKRRILGVGEGNENVFGFYRRYHFYPRTTILEQELSKRE